MPLDNIPRVSNLLRRALVRKKCTVACAESCTGGLLGAALTAAAGASDYFLGSAVCYTEAAKEGVLNVGRDLLDKHTAVSRASAEAMALGAKNLYGADFSLSITGFAGPLGESVGLVWIGWADKNAKTGAVSFVFKGDRAHVRASAVKAALRQLSILLSKHTMDC